MPIVFNEAWASVEDFERHCQRDAIVEFFENECLSDNGLVAQYNVTVYSDE
jgi:quinol monooxygenase YgiN